MEHTPGWYDRHVLPYLLDFACGLAPIARQRALVVPQAHGRVLEVGIGTGLNLAFYDRTKIGHLVGVDPAAQMHALAQRRSARAGLPVELVTLSAERLPLESGSFDCVVCTYTLCSIPDPLAALREMRRVLKSGGKLLYAEHGLAPDAAVARHQARIEPLWSKTQGAGLAAGSGLPGAGRRRLHRLAAFAVLQLLGRSDRALIDRRMRDYFVEGGAIVNCAISLMPMSASIAAICRTASSKPSCPKVCFSICSNFSDISS
jgi:SAM-dependent methyltransferase